MDEDCIHSAPVATAISHRHYGRSYQRLKRMLWIRPRWNTSDDEINGRRPAFAFSSRYLNSNMQTCLGLLGPQEWRYFPLLRTGNYYTEPHSTAICVSILYDTMNGLRGRRDRRVASENQVSATKSCLPRPEISDMGSTMYK